MTTEEKINVTADILSENNNGGIFSSRFDKKNIQKFRDLFSFGFESDECQAFAEETIDKLFDAAVYALNNGFDGSSVNLINGLMECTLATGGEKGAKKLEKIRQQRKNVLMSAKGENKTSDRIKKHVKAYINTSIQFSEIQIERWESDTPTKRSFIKSIEKFKELQKLVDDALDGNTVKAAQFAHSVDEKIVEWRNKVEEGICTEDCLKLLDNAIDVAREWNSSLNSAKVASDKNIYVYEGKDKVGATINVYNFAKDSIAAYRDQYDLRLSQIKEYDVKINENEREISRNNEKISELKEKALLIRKKLVNKAIDEKTANIELAPYVREINNIQNKIKGLQDQNRLNEVQKKVKEERLWLLKTVLDKYEENKNMPVELMASVSKINMNTMITVVDGVADKETAREVEDMMIELQALDLAKMDYTVAINEVLGRIKEDEANINEQYADIYQITEKDDQVHVEDDNIAAIDEILGFTDMLNADEVKEDDLRSKDEVDTVRSENKPKERFRAFGDSDR